MKFVAERDALLNTIGHAVGVVEKRNTIPILGNVLLEAAADGKVMVTATDLDIEIVEALTADVSEPGRITVPGHFLHDALRRLKAGSQVSFSTDGFQAKVESGKTAYKCGTLVACDFPSMSGLNAHHVTTFSIPVVDMRRLLDKTKSSISTEATRFYLNGTYLTVGDGAEGPTLRAVSTDGHRLSQCDVTLPDGAAGLPGIIIPRKTGLELRKLLAEYEGDVQVSTSDTKVQFVIGSTVFTSKLIDGTFPDYKRVIPGPGKFGCEATEGALADALECVSVVGSGGARAVKFGVTASEIILSGSNGDGNAAADSVDATTFGGNVEIGFNGRYLRDLLANIDGDNVQVSFADAGSPALINDSGDKNTLYVLMPMRV